MKSIMIKEGTAEEIESIANRYYNSHNLLSISSNGNLLPEGDKIIKYVNQYVVVFKLK